MQVLELYERWELGLEGQKPLKKLQAGQYRLYRTRYHEIKNFVFHMEGRAKNGEGGGDIREVWDQPPPPPPPPPPRL